METLAMATPTDEPATMETCGDESDPAMETIGVLSDVPMVSRGLHTGVRSANFKVTRGFGGIMENAKVNVDRLYLRQIMTGWGANRSDVIETNAVTGLGKTAVNNLGVYDGSGPRAKLVAKTYGMHTLAGKWKHWFTLEFEVERFKGSTLEVMGANDETEENEWAIVGGTGEFAMARGIISRRVYSLIFTQLTQELTIEFFCRMTVVPAPTKRGPWGGNNEGSLCEMEGKSQRLESVKINHGGTVNSIKFSYIHEVGRIRTTGVWGQTVGHDKFETIKFGPSEFVKQLTGIGGSDGTKVTKFKIITNHTTYGPFGVWDGTAPFTSNVPEDETVVGFFVYVQTFVHSIGVYTI